MALPASADFTGTGGTAIRTLTNWDGAASGVSSGACSIQSNTAKAAISSAVGIDWWTGDTFSADQKSSATVTSLANGTYIGVAVRCSGTDNGSNCSGYIFYSDSADGCYLEKYNGGAYTALAGPGTVFAVNDVIEISVSGTSIVGKVNGTTRLTATDSALTSGAAGICAYGNSTSAIDNWSGDNLAAAGIDGTLSKTLGALTSTATGTVALAGTLSKTLGSLAITATGTIGSTNIDGTLSKTLGALTSSATGALAIAGTLSKTLGALTSTATGALAIAGTASKTLGSLTVAARALHVQGAHLDGLLTVDPTNSRYVRNNNGIILLAGPHTWYSVIDGGVGNPAPTFDWATWDAFLVARGATFERLWCGYDSPKDWPDESGTRFSPLPWARTGPGNASDGYLKFDLSQISEEFLGRVEERVILAGNSGRYVSVLLYQGWQADLKGLSPGNPVANHPFAAANNINGINGNADSDSDILETRDVSNTAVLALQEGYVDALLARLNQYKHVTWEISNEETRTAQTVAWEEYWVDYIKTAEAGMTNQHLVIRSWQWPNGDNADLYASSADIVNIGGNNNAALSTPPTWPASGASGKVGGMDTDHHGGLSPVAGWHLKAFCNGFGVLLLMDSYDGAFGDDWRSDPDIEEMRYGLGYAADYAARIDLANATPQGSLASTGYCLAKTSGVVQLLAYQPTSGNFTVDLTGLAGTFSVEFLRTSNGATNTDTTVSGGAVRTLTAPWAGEDFVAFLELSNIDGALTATLGALTASATGTVALAATLTKTLGSLTVTAAATLANTGSLAATLGALTTNATGEGAIVNTGALAATLGALTATATGTLALAGVTSATLGALTCAATGALPIVGAASIALGALTVNAASVLTSGPTGELAQTLGALTSTATATVANTGTLAATLGTLTVAAVGVEVVIVSIVTGAIRGAGASGTVHGAGSAGTVRA
jgi:hypothetical protein